MGNEDLELIPAPLAPEVQTSFLEVWKNDAGPTVALRPVFHGTNKKNLASIFERGFLVPGMGNGLKVVNGSAHGLGIYTANLGAATLSRGFSRGAEGLLVGGVLDDAKPVDSNQLCGNLRLLAESPAVRHVGVATVVFDPRHVAPFFYVSRRK